MSRSKKTTRELVRKMYKCSKYGQENSDGIETAKQGFDRKLNKFFKFIFSHYIEEEFRAENLKDETYELLTEKMLKCVREYSLSNIESWIRIEKWTDLYRFYENKDVNGKINFMIDMLNMIGEIYKIENNIKDITKDEKIKRINKYIEIYAFIEEDYSRYCKSILDEKNQDKKEENKSIEELEEELEKCNQLLQQEIRDEGNREILATKRDLMYELRERYDDIGDIKRANELGREIEKDRIKSINRKVGRKRKLKN